MNVPLKIESDLAPDPVVIPVEAYISAEYARTERDQLWLKVWQIACREEDIPNVGDFYTYDILDQSVIIVRTAPETIVAHHNVCLHRGRRLTEGQPDQALLLQISRLAVASEWRQRQSARPRGLG